MATNKVIYRSILQGGGGDAWHHEVTPDGKHVYVTSHRTLWLYSTETKEINLVHDFVDEGPWSLVTDSKGNAYIGTYPGGKVFKYDLGLGTVTEDYGRMLGNQPQEYVRSIALDEEGGHIYAGTARSNHQTGFSDRKQNEYSATADGSTGNRLCVRYESG